MRCEATNEKWDLVGEPEISKKLGIPPMSGEVGARCGHEATRTYPGWRFGDRSAGEPALVEVETRLCPRHAFYADDAIAEGEAEARGS